MPFLQKTKWESFQRAKQYAPDKLVTLEIYENDKVEKIYIGIVQPNGSIFYLKKGSQRLLEHVRKRILLARQIPNFLASIQNDLEQITREDSQRFSDSLEDLGVKPPKEMGSTDSSRIAGSILEYPFKYAPLAAELISLPLRRKGVRLDHFIWPQEEFEPAQIRKLYNTLGPTDKNKLAATFPLLAEGPVTFELLFAQYENTWNLPVFEFVRRQVAIDEFRTEAARSLASASENLVFQGVFLLSGGALLGIAKTLVQSVKLATRLSSGVAFVLALLTKRHLEETFRLANLSDSKLQEKLRQAKADQVYGLDGQLIRADNEAGMARIDQKKAFGPLYDFIATPAVRQFLLDPFNYYEVSQMADGLDKGESMFRDILNSPTDAASQLIKAFGENSKHPDPLATNLFPDGINFDRNTLGPAIALGANSPTFRALAVAALGTSPLLTQSVVKAEKDMVAKHGNGQVIAIATRDIEGKPSTSKYILYSLAHELWHAFKKSSIRSEIDAFGNGLEFFKAAAADEALAHLISEQVIFEIDRKAAPKAPFRLVFCLEWEIT